MSNPPMLPIDENVCLADAYKQQNDKAKKSIKKKSKEDKEKK